MPTKDPIRSKCHSTVDQKQFGLCQHPDGSSWYVSHFCLQTKAKDLGIAWVVVVVLVLAGFFVSSMHYQLLPPCYPQNSYNLFFLVYLLFFIYLFIYFLFIGLFLLFLFYKLPTDLPTYFNLLTFLYLPSYPYIFLPTFIYHSFIYSNMNYLSCCPCWIFCSVYAISTPTTVLPLTYLPLLPTFATYLCYLPLLPTNLNTYWIFADPGAGIGLDIIIFGPIRMAEHLIFSLNTIQRNSKVDDQWKWHNKWSFIGENRHGSQSCLWLFLYFYRVDCSTRACWIKIYI